MTSSWPCVKSILNWQISTNRRKNSPQQSKVTSRSWELGVVEVSISDLGQIVTGKTPSTKVSDFYEGEYQFVTPADLDWRTYYCRATERTVTKEAKLSLQSKFIPPESVMVTCIGNTIGKCAISPSVCLTNQQINSIIPSKNVNPRFVYYLLIHHIRLIRSLGFSGGSATPLLNKDDFSRIRLRAPSRNRWDDIALNSPPTTT